MKLSAYYKEAGFKVFLNECPNQDRDRLLELSRLAAARLNNA
jgi:hypothetical protein